MNMSDSMLQKIGSRREMMGRRPMAEMAVIGLMTTLRVMPEDLYHKVMETSDTVEPGEVFTEIVRRFGNISKYNPGTKMMPGMRM